MFQRGRGEMCDHGGGGDREGRIGSGAGSDT